MPDKTLFGEVPTEVFNNFLRQLREAGESNDLVARLEKTVLTDGALSERDIRKALFPTDQTP